MSYTSAYIGRTGIVDAVIRSKIPLIKSGQLTDPLERRFLFTGPPGVAKTDLARALALVIAGHPVNVEFKMGTQINVELVRDWLRAAPYRPLFGEFFVKILDEVNTVPPAAITEVRQYFDELPRHVVVIATTNCAVNQLPEPLQTRFMVYKFQGVQTSQVAEFLASKFPELPKAVLTDIATQTAGNVRAALTDAAAHRDVIRFQQLAA
jgi:MoxR-like ATPase